MAEFGAWAETKNDAKTDYKNISFDHTVHIRKTLKQKFKWDLNPKFKKRALFKTIYWGFPVTSYQLDMYDLFADY